MENLNGNASGVNSLHPGELYDIELSKKDSSLGLSVTVLFGKVFTLFFVLHLFFPLPRLIQFTCCLVWFHFLLPCVGRSCGNTNPHACQLYFFNQEGFERKKCHSISYSRDFK